MPSWIVDEFYIRSRLGEFRYCDGTIENHWPELVPYGTLYSLSVFSVFEYCLSLHWARIILGRIVYYCDNEIRVEYLRRFYYSTKQSLLFNRRDAVVDTAIRRDVLTIIRREKRSVPIGTLVLDERTTAR